MERFLALSWACETNSISQLIVLLASVDTLSARRRIRAGRCQNKCWQDVSQTRASDATGRHVYHTSLAARHVYHTSLAARHVYQTSLAARRLSHIAGGTARLSHIAGGTARLSHITGGTARLSNIAGGRALFFSLVAALSARHAAHARLGL